MVVFEEDVACSVEIAVKGECAMWALEWLVAAQVLMKMTTGPTGLARVFLGDDMALSSVLFALIL